MGFYSIKKDIYSGGEVDNDENNLQLVGASTESTMNLYSGRGVFYWMIMTTVAKADVHKLYPNVDLDGNNVIGDNWGYLVLNDYLAMDGKLTAPLRLIEYNVDGICSLEIFYPNGLPFNESCKIYVRNDVADSFQVRWQATKTIYS